MRDSTLSAVAFSMLLFTSGTPAQSAPVPVPAGVWGGNGIQLTVSAKGAVLDYGCDAGTISEPLISDASGKFLAYGTHSFGRGGPRQLRDSVPKPPRARYQGRWNGAAIRLTVSLPELGRTIGEFTLELGRRASLERCG